MINLLRQINFSFVIAGRVQPDDKIDPDEYPRYGFYWWFWIPELNHNGAKFSNPEQCFGLDLLFLCFSVGFILWPITNHPKNGLIRKLYRKLEE